MCLRKPERCLLCLPGPRLQYLLPKLLPEPYRFRLVSKEDAEAARNQPNGCLLTQQLTLDGDGELGNITTFIIEATNGRITTCHGNSVPKPS